MKPLDFLGDKMPLLKDVKRLRHDVERLRAAFTQDALERLRAEERYRDPRRLPGHEAQVFSQGGEDGILGEIFSRIGTTGRTFLEIGVGNGIENNTAFLLWQGWSGWWVDGHEASIRAARERFRRPLAEGKLAVHHAFVTAEGVSDLVRTLGVPAECDLFSLDVDRNTYWIWAALREFRPRVAVVEYNATLPPGVDWKVEYAPHRTWNGTAYFGASLKALELLGRERGYRLVGCTLGGVNAFFVREDLVGDRFAEPFTAENHYEPPRYALLVRQGHPAGFSDE